MEMAGETKNDAVESATNTDTKISPTKKKKGVLSRIWNALFRLRGDDFEKRLQYITKEEASVLARIKRRSHSSRRIARNLIILTVVFEVIIVGYAIMTTRSLDLDWKMRALRALPIFLLPALSSITYSALGSFTRMDQKKLEKLQAERQAKIDELKERTNYYTTQQLIQYDLDPAAKAAAATVLASKLGADSGLKVHVVDESKLNAPTAGKSNEVEVERTSGLRNRKPSHTKSNSINVHHPEEEMLNHAELESPHISEHQQVIVEHHHQTGSSTHDAGWIARIAALLVGEDPTQSFALICGNCHMHNGLARQEDFPYITYYCPHCNALNKPKQSDQRVSGSSSPNTTTSMNVVDAEVTRSAGDSIDRIPVGNSPVAAALETSKSEKIATGNSVN
ncbi:uncharacterized protein At2g24330-like [Olea europaea subsp. europaea]|uniref:Uncharacterized protein At2g24330-like n=1 Tax=Olea europaea subsp. europaea TaxID=158383 RepID=A0A8S0SVG2_OLEEU|nr:uncharacterized protein At2g24330-like [Olea europaea subsp. europaea]